MNKNTGIDGHTKERMRRLAVEGTVLTDYDCNPARKPRADEVVRG